MQLVIINMYIGAMLIQIYMYIVYMIHKYYNTNIREAKNSKGKIKQSIIYVSRILQILYT